MRNLPRYVACAKLLALANGAESVRAELEGRPPDLREGFQGGRAYSILPGAR